MHILCILTDEFEELEAIGTIALLRRAGITTDIVALHKTTATGRFDISMQQLQNSDDVNLTQYDALFLPGGPHYKTLMQSKVVTQTITHFIKEHKVIAAICAAPTILGKLGYLKDKNYTCFTSLNEDFQGIYHHVPVICDDNIITGRSAAATIDFAFAIIQKLCGTQHAQSVKDAIYYEN